MSVIPRKVSIDFEPVEVLEAFSAQQLENTVLRFNSEPDGKVGDEYLYYIDAEYLAEVLNDPDEDLQEQERKMIETLKHVAEAEGGGFYLTFC